MYLSVIFINLSHQCPFMLIYRPLVHLIPIHANISPTHISNAHSCQYIAHSYIKCPLMPIYRPLIHLMPTHANISPTYTSNAQSCRYTAHLYQYHPLLYYVFIYIFYYNYFFNYFYKHDVIKLLSQCTIID